MYVNVQVFLLINTSMAQFISQSKPPHYFCIYTKLRVMGCENVALVVATDYALGLTRLL